MHVFIAFIVVVIVASSICTNPSTLFMQNLYIKKESSGDINISCKLLNYWISVDLERRTNEIITKLDHLISSLQKRIIFSFLFCEMNSNPKNQSIQERIRSFNGEKIFIIGLENEGSGGGFLFSFVINIFDQKNKIKKLLLIWN